MEETYPLHGDAKRIGGNLDGDRLQALADVRRADEDRNAAVRLDHHAGVLPRPRAAAFDEAPYPEAVISPVHERGLEMLLRFPVDLLQAAVQRLGIVPAVELLFLCRQ